MNNYSKDIHILNGKVLTLEESINLINKQNREIANLKSELSVVLNERDLLLCEVSKLKFELEIADLKRIHDDKIPYLNKKESIDAVNNTLQEYVGNAEGPDDHIDKDIMRFTGSDVEHNSPVDNASHGCHMWYNTEERDKLNIIFNTSGNGVKHTRTQNGHANYELSQDLLDKQIELLERKYGGPGAREAAIIIQRAFRRYTLLKKFTHITAMAKAEKRLSRRILTYPEHSSVIENGCSVTTRSNLTILSPDMKNNCCNPTASMVPVRSLSMREKRIAELENGTNSLPRMYSTAHCSANFNNSYCCNVVSTCSHMCSSVYPDVYVNVDLKKCSNPIELPLSQPAHTYPCSSVSSSTLQSVSFRNYQMEMCSKAVNSQQTIHHYHQNNSNTSSMSSPNQINSSSYIQSQQMCTPTKKVPPEVPKRTSSISLRSVESAQNNSNASNSSSISFGKTQYSGSLSSVQSSSSDSSSTMNASNNSFAIIQGYTSTPECNKHVQIPELVRKRQYRVGLNLFNKKPEKGITYLMGKGFLENSPAAVAKFLIARKGLSKQMIGEYLGNVQDPFSSAVLECFAHELDLSGMQVDVALRKFQTYFRMPGEAQKIERLMEVFSHRYCQCNRDIVSKLRSLDTIFVLAFAIIMLNTDLHTPNLKADRRMKLQDFIKNLRGVDDCCDIDQDMLVGIYERIKANEFKPGSDHVSQVMKVQSTIMGKKPNLAVSYRRLVCYCRLYEVPDVNKKERPGLHQREVFLFNDLLVITKTLSKKKNLATYTYRKSFSLSGLTVAMFQTAYYPCGIRIIQRVDNKVLITFNARNEHDRSKFVADVHESILEMREMENIRIEAELEKQKNARTNRCNGGNSSNNDHRDSGVADVEVCPCLHSSSDIPLKQEIISKSYSAEQCVGLLKRSALSNSLIDIHDQEDKPHRCGSVGSLDSGMSVSFQQHQPSVIKNNDVPSNGLPYRKHALH